MKNWQEVVERFSDIPRLIKKTDDGRWEVDLKTPSLPRDPASEGTIWWWARPRWSLDTIEIRVFDSGPLEMIRGYIEEVMKLL